MNIQGKAGTFLLLVFYLLISGCSSTKPVSATDQNPGGETEPTASSADTVKSSCLRFQDSPRKNYLLDQYVLYRDKIKAEKFEEAFDLWKVVYEEAPAADGKRSTVFRDGIKLYDYFFKQEQDTARKRAHVEQILSLYDQMVVCSGEKAYVQGLKAFDLYYSYREFTTDQVIFGLFREAVDSLGEETPAFVCNPFSALLVQLTFSDDISIEDAQHYADRLKMLIDSKFSLLEQEALSSEGWDIVQDYALSRLEDLEGVDGFYDCTYYMDRYYSTLTDSRGDCDALKTIYGKLRWGGCSTEDDRLQEVRDALVEGNCVETRSAENSAVREAYAALEEGRYKEAVDLFETLAESTESDDRKASFFFIISKIYYAHLKRFTSARSYALKAAKYREGWGEPYVLIGKLYASSGPLCGPGRGWDSQIVTWPAIDKWEYARSIDPAVAKEASTLIERYKEFMPSMEDIHQRTLQVGAPFKVGCWIQETTTIRPGRKF